MLMVFDRLPLGFVNDVPKLISRLQPTDDEAGELVSMLESWIPLRPTV
jgi:hypothetical protein